MIRWQIGNRLFIILAVVFSVCFFTPRAQAADEFLKFHWAFDEGSGTTAGDSSGNVPSYPGTLYNGPTWISDGGLTFDGIDDFARTDSAIPNSMGVSDQGYTLSASVRLPDAEENGNIIHISNGANGVGWCIAMLHVDNGHFRAIGWNSGPVIAVDPTEATPGQWYSIANTWSPDTKEMDLYVNGVLVAATPMNNFTAANEDVYIFAGLDAGGCDNDHGWFKGDIKDVRIYSRAITQTEAQDNSNQSISVGPYVSSFSPANNATNVHTDTSLVATFSTTTMATSTGSIGIYKTADDSLVESIPVSSPQITIDGAVVTMHPSTPLLENTGYYISIPGTAFMDASTTPYVGTTASTTWSFTIGDFTAPVISDVATSSVATTTATVTWTTNEDASTRLWYSVDTAYASSADEADADPRVTSHEATLSDLIGCTFYHYEVVSRDAAGNAATSTPSSFTTTGCSGGATPSSSTSTPVTVSGAATTTLTDSDRTLSVVTPADFTATSSSVVIQIKALPSTTVLDSIGKPSDSLTSAAAIVFEVTALIDNITTLDSFDVPVTITYTYTDADVAGLDESTLTMYHYHDGAWLPLDNCSVNTSTNTITCTSQSFSTFAIFGSPVSTRSSGGGYSSRSGGIVSWWNQNVPNSDYSKLTQATSTQVQKVAQCPGYNFTRVLRFGMRGGDVQALQKLMNCLGFKLADSGPGSPGKETTLFVDRTYNAVKKFQEAYVADILAPLKLVSGTGVFAGLSQKKVKSLSR